MIRRGFFCILSCLFLLGTGCEKAPESNPEATLARGGLMPTGMSDSESIYVADQSSIKVLPEPAGLSYASLGSFKSDSNKDSAKEPAKGSRTKSGKKTKKGPVGRFKDSLRGLFGG